MRTRMPVPFDHFAVRSNLSATYDKLSDQPKGDLDINTISLLMGELARRHTSTHDIDSLRELESLVVSTGLLALPALFEVFIQSFVKLQLPGSLVAAESAARAMHKEIVLPLPLSFYVVLSSAYATFGRSKDVDRLLVELCDNIQNGIVEGRLPGIMVRAAIIAHSKAGDYEVAKKWKEFYELVDQNRFAQVVAIPPIPTVNEIFTTPDPPPVKPQKVSPDIGANECPPLLISHILNTNGVSALDDVSSTFSDESRRMSNCSNDSSRSSSDQKVSFETASRPMRIVPSTRKCTNKEDIVLPLIKSYISEKRSDDVCRCFNMITEKGIRPSNSTYELVLDYFLEMEETDKVKHYYAGFCENSSGMDTALEQRILGFLNMPRSWL